jgi:hypothetical protein
MTGARPHRRTAETATVIAAGAAVLALLTGCSAAVPAVIAGLPPARWIGASGLTGFAVDTEGGLWGWGSGLAMGAATPVGAPGAAHPVRIPQPGPVLAVAGGHAIVGPAGPGVAL